MLEWPSGNEPGPALTLPLTYLAADTTRGRNWLMEEEAQRSGSKQNRNKAQAADGDV